METSEAPIAKVYKNVFALRQAFENLSNEITYAMNPQSAYNTVVKTYKLLYQNLGLYWSGDTEDQVKEEYKSHISMIKKYIKMFTIENINTKELKILLNKFRSLDYQYLV